jgi:hypothetical protein
MDNVDPRRMQPTPKPIAEAQSTCDFKTPLVVTSPTSGGSSVGIVRSRTKDTEIVF